MVYILIFLMVLYDWIVYPKLVEQRSEQYVKQLGGYVVQVKALSRRDSIYLIEYVIDGQRLRANARCNLFGQIKEWI